MKNQLSTENTVFSVDKSGHLIIRLTSKRILDGEIARVLKMAVMHCRRKKTKKPVTWNKWWSGRYYIHIPTLNQVA